MDAIFYHIYQEMFIWRIICKLMVPATKTVSSASDMLLDKVIKHSEINKVLWLDRTKKMIR